jgi:hypothetical protein
MELQRAESNQPVTEPDPLQNLPAKLWFPEADLVFHAGPIDPAGPRGLEVPQDEHRGATGVRPLLHRPAQRTQNAAHGRSSSRSIGICAIQPRHVP